MNTLLKKVLLIVVLATQAYSVNADQAGMSAQDTQALVLQNKNVLFIDVRDPIEIMFVGFTDAVDINIPFLMVDRSEWDEKNNRFRFYQNPDFIKQVKAALTAKGLGDDATIITMCRSGSGRGLPSANFLEKNGFKNAHYVLHGFQGDSIKEGGKSGFRIKNGWQNEGLQWQSKLNPEKIYPTDR